jgi:hypothetical protein
LCLEERPFSLNTHYLADYKDKFLAYYKGYREKDANSNLMANIRTYPAEHNPIAPYGISKIMAGLVEAGVTGMKPSDLVRLLPADQMEPAINIMAVSRGHLLVKRLINLCRMCERITRVGFCDHFSGQYLLTVFHSRIQTLYR